MEKIVTTFKRVIIGLSAAGFVVGLYCAAQLYDALLQIYLMTYR